MDSNLQIARPMASVYVDRRPIALPVGFLGLRFGFAVSTGSSGDPVGTCSGSTPVERSSALSALALIEAFEGLLIMLLHCPAERFTPADQATHFVGNLYAGHAGSNADAFDLSAKDHVQIAGPGLPDIAPAFEPHAV